MLKKYSEKLKHWQEQIGLFYRHYDWNIIFYIVVFLIIAGAAYLLLNFFVLINNNKGNLKLTENQNINTAFVIEADNRIRKRINGEIINSDSEKNLPPVAVMVENSSESWPQAGLEKADLVYEALAESSITRFLAIYANSETIERIGPVRSARPYYVDWAMGYDAAYLHVGGSPQALDQIRQDKVKNVDEFFHPYFWRAKNHYAPHNTYTSSELINEMITDRQYQSSDFTLWQYKDEAVAESRPDNFEIKVKYDGVYKVTWKYNKNDNNYTRYQNLNPHKMDNGAFIKAKNIIVSVHQTKVLDDVGRKFIQTLGQGTAWIFCDGQVIQGTWRKDSKKEREKYFDESGQEIKFNGGITWVEVIPKETMVEY